MLAGDSGPWMGLCQGLIAAKKLRKLCEELPVGYERFDRLVVEGAFEVMLEFVQEHIRIGRGNDGPLARYVTTKDPPDGRSLLLGLQAA